MVEETRECSGVRGKIRITPAKLAREWQAELNAFLEASIEGFILFDKNLNLIAINPSAQRLVGLSEEVSRPSIGKNIQELIPGIKETGRYEEYVNVLKTGQPFLADDIVPHQKFGNIHLSTKAFKAGKGLGIITSDITERKRTEDLVRAQRGLGMSLSAIAGLDEGLSLCLEAALRVSGMDCGGIYLVDETSGDLDMVFHKGLSPDFVNEVLHYDAESANTRLVMRGKPVYTRHHELGVPLDEVEYDEGLRAMTVVPILHEHRVIGCLNVASHSLEKVPLFVRDALEAIATQIGSAIARLRVEAALKESEDRFRSIFREARDGIVLIDPETGYINDCNLEFEKQTGRKVKELKTMKIWEIRPPEKTEAAKKKISEARAKGEGEGEGESGDLEFQKPDGEIVPIEFKSKVVGIRSKQYIQSISRDITVRKRAEAKSGKCRERLEELVEQRTAELKNSNKLLKLEIREHERAAEALRKSEEKYRTIFESSREAIIISDPEGTIVTANPAAVMMLGYENQDDMVGIPTIELYSEPDYVKTLLDEVMKKGYLDRCEVRLKKRDGTLVYALGSAASRRDVNGSVQGVDSVFMDITEFKLMQERLSASERLASLGQFSGNVSHELRNSLATIGSSVYYLKTKLKDSNNKIQKHLERMESAIDGATNIIESLLNLTRMPAPREERLDLRTIVSEAIAAEHVPARISVRRDFPEQAVSIRGDPEQLRMAFKNIVSNAVEAMGSNGKLTVRVNGIADEGTTISFIDTGPGIAPEKLRKVFEPLYSTKPGGFGFGLSIAKMVIERHRGIIEAESKPGEGATFIVRLPMSANEDEER